MAMPIGGMITMLRNFTFAAHNGGSYTSEWIRVPEGFQNWQLTVLVHGRISSTVASLLLVTSWDTGLVHSVGVSVNLATLGVQEQDISTDMGPMARLILSSTDDSVVTISVFLTPKSQ